MSIKKIVMYDLRSGVRSNLIKLFFLTGLMLLIDCIAVYTIRNIENSYRLKATVMDYICFIFGGPKHIPKNMFELYEIPVLWLAPRAMIAYITGCYAMTDLHAYGMQILIRSGSRVKWWLSKCIWNGFMVILSYAIIYLEIIIMAFIGGANKKLSLTPEIVTSVCNISELNGDGKVYIAALFLMPVIVMLALSMLQMTLALIFSPIIGFIISQSILFLSTVFEYQFLIANYEMLSHYNVTCGSDINAKEGLLLCGLTYFAAVMTGIIYFMKYNVLPKNSDI